MVSLKQFVIITTFCCPFVSCNSVKDVQVTDSNPAVQGKPEGTLQEELKSYSEGLSLDDIDKSIPYFQIPDAPNHYSGGAVLSRTIDGLGYRYYWATHQLRVEDLNYNPGNDGRSARETLDHLYGLSNGLMHVAQQTPNPRPLVIPEVSFLELRTLTLQNFKVASDIFRTVEDVSSYPIVFQRGDKTSEFPVWHVMNGFLADALYHTGQIVSYRRSSGNPQHPGVSVFMGKTSL